MDYNKVMAIATSFLAFSTFLGILFALIYYVSQIKEISLIIGMIIAIIYIDINLSFLYYLRKKGVI